MKQLFLLLLLIPVTAFTIDTPTVKIFCTQVEDSVDVILHWEEIPEANRYAVYSLGENPYGERELLDYLQHPPYLHRASADQFFFVIAEDTLTHLDSDGDGLPDSADTCPEVAYEPLFDWLDCAPMDLNPYNDLEPECRMRERIADVLLNSGMFVTHIACSVVIEGEIQFADAFTYLGGGEWEHDPEGVYRLYRIGSTSKPIAAVAAKVLEAEGLLSLEDYVSDDDGSQLLLDGEVTLRQLLSQTGAFSLDNGALHLYCYPGDLIAFWVEPDNLVSPHYDSDPWGNLGGEFEYSAFNYSLAGAHLMQRSGQSYGQILQSRVFDPCGMCTATVDGVRANGVPIGSEPGTSQTSLMVVGPYINLVSQSDDCCEDNYYSSDDLPDDPFSWQQYQLDEADSEARDPAGGVMASVIDMAHFAQNLLASYHGTGGVLSPAEIRDLWEAEVEATGMPWDYYGLGFFTDSVTGEPINEVEHGGSRPSFRSGFVIRPELNMAVSVLVNAGVSAVVYELGGAILDDFVMAASGGDAAGEISLPGVVSVQKN